jgi:glycosyltransferase involved in cell wall biosynthesis
MWRRWAEKRGASMGSGRLCSAGTSPARFSDEAALIESMPRVSIILPIYNRGATVPRCIRSVLSQTFSDFELVAVDDASTDNSIRAVETFGDARIRLLRHTTNAGPSAARNTAIRDSTGELIALIDSDDEWLPEKLEKQIRLIDLRSAELCVCEYYLADRDGEHHHRLPEPTSWRDELHLRCELGNGTTLLVRRKIIEAVGLLDESLRLYEDWDWVLRMVQCATLHVLHEPLARIHAGSARSAELFGQSAERFLKKHAQEFLRLGSEHHRSVRAAHLQFVAASAFASRRFALGSAYLLRSYLTQPLQNPMRLAALPLAPVDALCGTSLIERAATWQRLRRRTAAGA